MLDLPIRMTLEEKTRGKGKKRGKNRTLQNPGGLGFFRVAVRVRGGAYRCLFIRSHSVGRVRVWGGAVTRCACAF